MTLSPIEKLEALCKAKTLNSFPLHSRVHKMTKENLYVKRDDELGFSVSGSKLRKYASLIPFLMKKEEKIALVGSPFSNHILSFVQLLKQEKIPYKLFLEKPSDMTPKGNFFFLSLLTAKDDITWVDKVPDSLTDEWTSRMGKDLFFIPIGGCIKEGLPGALTLPLDIIANEKEVGVPFDNIFVDSGTGLTAAALILGLHYLKKRTKVHVVLMAGEEAIFEKQLEEFKKYFEKLLEESTGIIKNYRLLRPSTGKSFGSSNATVLKEVIRAATEEGIFLDPIYTAKLLLKTRELMQEGMKGNCLWIHSGGALSLSGFQEALSRYL